jgi:predicted flap endonuclease-1-like 5' DNA nuclease
MFEQIYPALLPAAGLAAGTVITYIYGQRKVNQRDDHIEELEDTVKTRDDKIKSLNKNLKEHEATMEALNTDLSQRDTTIQSLEKHISERNEHVDTLNADIAGLTRQNQETMDRAVGAEARVSELQTLTQEKEQKITALKAKERAMQDDFTHLDGVGPKISATLRSAGVKTFTKLAAKEVDDLRGILVAENPSLLRLSDPTTWPEQAEMAAEGRWETLKTLQEGIRERRRRERLSLQQRPEIETTTVITEA